MVVQSPARSTYRHYQKSQKLDRLLEQNKEQARVLAGKISDEKRREEILTKLK